MEKYTSFEKIGEGSFGVVYKAINRHTGKEIAVKKMKLTNMSDGVSSAVLREISVLHGLHHPNVVEFLDVVLTDNNHLFLVFEFLNMDLKCFLNTMGPLQKGLVKSYLRQLLKGVAYCHAHRILHRDLKPQNLLVDGAGHIKLADFGLTCSINVHMRAYTSEVVTLWYRAPEILLGSQFYSTAVDVWSVACIFAEMTIGRTLFQGDSQIDQIFRVFSALGTPGTDGVWEGARLLPDYVAVFPRWPAQPAHALLAPAAQSDPHACALFDLMLCYDPSERLSANAALQHPFVRDAPLVLPPPDRPDLPH